MDMGTDTDTDLNTDTDMDTAIWTETETRTHTPGMDMGIGTMSLYNDLSVPHQLYKLKWRYRTDSVTWLYASDCGPHDDFPQTIRTGKSSASMELEDFLRPVAYFKAILKVLSYEAWKNDLVGKN
jgi:hypothetical protein